VPTPDPAANGATTAVGRVLICHPGAELYGSDRVVIESVAALADAGWRVAVAVPNTGPLVARLTELGARVEVIDTVVLRKALLRPAGLLTLARQLAPSSRAAWRLLRDFRPDVVYVNTVTIPLWIVVARLLRRPVLVHVHEAEDTVAPPVRAALAAPTLLARAVIVNSAVTGELVASSMPGLRKRLRRRISLVYNGVPGPEHVDQPRAQLSAPVRVVQIGRLSPRKGTDLVVDALALLRDSGREVVLELLGSVFPGYEWYEEQLREQVSRLGLDSAVTFGGFADSVWSAYERADIAVVASRAEPFGNAAVEAQLAQRPVVVTRVQGLVETVDGGRFGRIVDADDPAALAGAIAAIIDDWPAALTIAAQARPDAEQRFAPARYRAEIVAAVTQLAPR
jgi:glycosyltransferase involved in cell wall biosynthesis